MGRVERRRFPFRRYIHILQMFEERSPFADIQPSEAKRLILEGKTLDPPEMLKRQGSELLKLYRECLHQECDRRPQMEDIVCRLDACLPRRSRRGVFV